MKVTLDIPDGIVCGFFNGVEITSEGIEPSILSARK